MRRESKREFVNMRHIFIVNPCSGPRDRTGEIRKAIQGKPSCEVYTTAGPMDAARYVTENFAGYAKLQKRDMLRLCLLVEESLGMVKAMVDDFFGQMWFDGDDKSCAIHMELVSNMNSDKKEQ